MSATRQPSRPGVARPVTGRPANAPAASTGSPRRVGRAAAPQAGRRRRTAALVLSPLARQIAALGLAFCAVALSLAYPLRHYLQQQAAEQAAVAEQHQLEEQIADLKAQQAALKDPAYIKAEAKRRLQYVTPGDTVYVVKVPETTSPTAPPADPNEQYSGSDGSAGAVGDASAGDGGSGPPVDGSGGEPWYASMWDTLNGSGDAALAPAK